ncbi:Malectin-like domain [Dillenia turbinata]|uniref:Malectin-like domain n=1 Tax=Dillenia turbinata TaxID=194707 RepID=A0AAN8VB83_9MAGN
MSIAFLFLLLILYASLASATGAFLSIDYGASTSSQDTEQGTKVVLRESFYYGNYDSESSPPTFDLHFDGNYWDTIVTSHDEASYMYRETTYVVKGNSISVCVAQTYANQFPFISALEIRSLVPTMYSKIDPVFS